MRLTSIAAGVSVAALAITLAGCTGGGTTDGADGATFTMALSADPGSLDPQASAATALYQVTQFAYDTLVSIDKDGVIGSQLASEWSVDGQTVSLTLNEGITCSDGAPFTAEDAAANLNWVADPANESPMLGVFLPVGATATAEDDTTLTLQLASPSPFVLNGLAALPIVCGSAVDDRGKLGTETLGTGPFVLTEAAQGDQYVYELRDDYAWGPDGFSADAEGLPAKVVVRIVTNETTAANLLLSGELNASNIVGSDSDRLEAAGLFFTETPAVIGEMWFNHSAGRPTSDPQVRLALLQALDLDQVMNVVTSGKGTPGTAFAANDPIACPGSSVADALPEYDPEAAADLLDEAGWVLGSDGVRTKDGAPLALTFLQQSGASDGTAAGAELTTQVWTELGVQVTSQAQEENALLGIIFGTGEWDVSWVPLNVGSPDQVVPFLSGPTVPDGGTNFAAIDNADYNAGVQAASQLSGQESCPAWLDAEAALVRDADVVPFANQLARTYGAGAKFETIGFVVPTSIRMN